MNRFTALLLALMTTGLLGACADPNHYPVSGEECGPDDPVKTLDSSIADCVPVVS